MLYKKRLLLILLIIVTSNFISLCQTAGDYQTITTLTDTKWSTITNWQVYDGSSWISATDYPGFNSGTGKVSILDNTALIIDKSIPNPIGLLFIDGNTANSSLTFGGAYSMSVTDVSFNTSITSSVSNTLDIALGTLDVSNTLTLSTPIQNTLSITGAGTLRIGNQFISTGTTAFDPASTVEFYSTLNQSIPSTNGYGNIVLSGSATKTIASPLTVNGNITIGTGIELNDGGNIITGAIGKTFTLSATATYTSLQSASTIFPQNCTISLDNTSSVNFNGNGSYTLPATPVSYGNITVNGTSTVTLSSAITVNGDLTVNTGATLNDGGFAITGISGKTFNVGANASFTTLRTVTPWFPTTMTINLDPLSTTNFSGIGSYVLSSTPASFGSLAITGNGSVTLSNPIAINGNFNIKTGSSLNDGGYVITGSSGTFSVGSGATYTTQQTAAPYLPQGFTASLDANSSFVYGGIGSYTLPSTPSTYGSLTFAGTGIITLSSAITINGNLSINNGAELNDGGFVITGTLGKQFTIQSGGTYTTMKIATPWFPTLQTPNFDANSTVKFNGNGAFILPATPAVYGNLIFNANVTHTLSASITINGSLTINAGTLVDAGKQITGNSTGTFTMMTGTALTLGTTTVATSFPTLFTSVVLNSTSTVTYNSNVAQTISNIPIYSNITLTSTGTITVTKTVSGTVSINGILTVNANNNLNDGGNVISCNGNITVNGTQTGTGELKTTGTVAQYIAGTGSITNLEIAKTGIAYINSATFIVNGNIIVTTGTLHLNARTLLTGGSITIASGALFTVNGNAVLKVISSSTITNNGTFTISGTALAIAKVTINGTTGQFTYTQSGTATLSAQYYEFDNCQLNIPSGTVTGNLSNGTFSTIGSNSNAEYLNFDGFTSSFSPVLVVFNTGPTYNVRKTSGTGGIISFSATSGTKNGASNQDPLNAGFVTWSGGKKFYSKQNVGTPYLFSNTLNWSANSDGSGANPAPADFTSKTSTFVIQSSHTITEDVVGLDVFHLSVVSGGTLTIGNSTLARTLTVEENFVDSGTVTVGAFAATHTLNLYGNLTVAGIGIFNLYNNASQVVNTNFNDNAVQNIDGTPTNIVFNNITLAGLTNVTPAYPLIIKGNVVLGANTTFSSGSFSHTVMGNWTGNATATHNSTGTIIFGGTSTAFTNPTNFNNVTFNGGGLATIGGAASAITIAGNLLITNATSLSIGNQATVKTISVAGDITIDALSTLIVGAFTATHVLTLSGNLIVNGGFNMFTATGQVCNITFSGTNSKTITGSGSLCNFNSLTVNKGTDSTTIVEVLRPITIQQPTTAANNLVLASGTFKLSSASTLKPYLGSQTICLAPARLWINNASADISSYGAGTSTTAQVATVTGTLLVSHGSFKYGSGSDKLVLTAATSALKL